MCDDLETSRKRAVNNYRKRLRKRGLARFEVLGLAGDSPDSSQIRAAVRRELSAPPPNKGGILKAFRRSPLVGAELNLERPVTADRKLRL